MMVSPLILIEEGVSPEVNKLHTLGEHEHDVIILRCKLHRQGEKHAMVQIRKVRKHKLELER